ncbi:hypothetical protein OXIME_001459 [Oxyplasma meridianum]|uniref:Uncharacterized protein n=1 Tax=Oxyplasma meridianum TaxID=3073602 RepID=A0AAX4NIH8_9ARCH
MRHQDTFSGFIDVSGDSGFEYCYLRDFPLSIDVLGKLGVKGFLKKFRSSNFHENQDLTVNDLLSMSAFYSPDPGEELRIKLPFDLSTGKVHDHVWGQLKEWTHCAMSSIISLVLKKIKIILQKGSHDEFSINTGINGISQIMKEKEIDHCSVHYDAGHFGIYYMYKDSV